MTNFKHGVLGGMAFSLSYSLSLNEIYKTIILACIGAIASFLVSYMLRKFLKNK